MYFLIIEIFYNFTHIKRTKVAKDKDKKAQ